MKMKTFTIRIPEKALSELRREHARIYGMNYLRQPSNNIIIYHAVLTALSIQKKTPSV